MIGTADLSQFLQGFVTPYTADEFATTNFLQGDANRYFAPTNGASTFRISSSFAPT